MTVLLQFLFAVGVIIFTYVLYTVRNFYKTRRQLAWMKEVPGWPLLGCIAEFGDNTRVISDFQRLINQHGKLLHLDFLMDPNIVATDYDFVEYILSKQDVLDKALDYRYLHKWLGTGLLTSDGPKWKKRRRMATPAFHFSVLEQFIEVFERNLEILISELEKEVDKDSMDIYPYINLYTMDVICETSMGVSVNAQKDKKSNYVKNVKEMCRIFLERAFALFKSNDYLYVLFPDFYKELKTVKALHNVTDSVINARKKELELLSKEEIREDKDDVGRKKKMAFLDILLKSTIDGEPLSKEDIREEVDTFMFEGHDTVSSALSFTLYLLAMHLDVQKKAVEEQRYIFESNIHRNSTYIDLQAMKYLELVIKEALRLYPPVPMFGRHTNQEVQFKGNVIPKGININIFCYGILRDPDNFVDPDKFDPERFEHSDGTRPYAFIPFSAGPRNCIGQKFAMLELKSTLSKILRNFELLPAVPEHKIVLVSEAVLKSRNGVRIRLIRRNW
ncbi:hypothetical protein NQ315_017066 [Exocentrus adspersus]|uniref:Cytochrome P450 n=1 Tax=Exocentrus adspersus TaxID=1586481 RepID=A0AAV8VGK8_9CUCU|nr:hypothetical protein NQ315_017066 [Exocentrus adspersus]